MAYTALYRKWRPTRFEEVRGQEHIVRTLKNQMNSGRIGHAYLFSGTRGTGKTSIAKIFARAVNCEHPVNGSPCNECASCRSILAGTSVNVAEIDAASNNGVDNIREIREEVKYRPTEGKYRVYIIDEVHMLSAGAFNALLKTLEEPPEYVIFILATTEVQKIPITVLSRCQRYDFKRLSMDELKKQITDLLTAEKVDYEEGAVSYVARAADGSSRDALSLLEQCISFYYGEKLTYENVLEVLGAVDQRVFSELVEKILSYDVTGAVGIVDRLVSSGRDIAQFVLDFTWYLRNLMLIQNEDPGEDVLGVSRENLEEMKAVAAEMSINQVMRCIRIMSELSNRMRYASQKRVLLELAVIKMMQPAMENDPESLIERVEYLERHGVKSPDAPAEGTRRKQTKAPEIPMEQREIEVPEEQFNDWKQLSADWDQIVERQGKLFTSLFRGTKISVGEQEDGSVTILFRDPYNYSVADKTDKASDAQRYLEENYHRKFSVRLRCLKENEAAPVIKAAAHIPGIEMEIGTEE